MSDHSVSTHWYNNRTAQVATAAVVAAGGLAGAFAGGRASVDRPVDVSRAVSPSGRNVGAFAKFADGAIGTVWEDASPELDATGKQPMLELIWHSEDEFDREPPGQKGQVRLTEKGSLLTTVTLGVALGCGAPQNEVTVTVHSNSYVTPRVTVRAGSTVLRLDEVIGTATGSTATDTFMLSMRPTTPIGLQVDDSTALYLITNDVRTKTLTVKSAVNTPAIKAELQGPNDQSYPGFGCAD